MIFEKTTPSYSGISPPEENPLPLGDTGAPTPTGLLRCVACVAARDGSAGSRAELSLARLVADPFNTLGEPQY